ncbi:hypothetical protein BD410DRAFT_808023 [Rickenella mellea]|uniref:3-carboxymuconate cyclase n=1 Tax=Rickenella mellea TaxID=50990 RepID=A0A4Y7PNG2_9AGAM|nr:hypothetical protein BD410DRAFT_808023 [Rickenella mellea]
MKVSSSLVVASIAFASSLVSASPLATRKASKAKNNTADASNAAGALYFITNEPAGNHVVASAIGTDGKLTFGKAHCTQGRGQHGVTDPDGPDGLFSQGSVKVSAAANALVAVNPGSNTVSMFSINPENPIDMKLIGGPVSSEGEFPMSVALNKNGTMACVLNGGAVNGVMCYSIDQNMGLMAMNNSLRSLGLNQTTPPAGPAGTTSHIVFSEDNTKLIASVKGTPPNDPGFLATWDISPDDGSLSQDFTKATPSQGGLLPFSMTVIPGKNAILATDAGVGFDIFDFSGGNNASSSIVPIEGQKATCWSSFSEKTGNFYLTDIGTATVTEVNVDDNLKGSIVKQYPQTAGSGTIDNDIANVGGNDFMYVLGANATQIDVLSLGAPGQAQGIQTFDIAGPAKAAGVKINPFNLQGMTSFIKKN